MLACGQVTAADVPLFINHCKEARLDNYELFENSTGNWYKVFLRPDNTNRFSVNALCINSRFALRLIEESGDWNPKEDW